MPSDITGLSSTGNSAIFRLLNTPIMNCDSYTGVLLLSREMAVKEALPCDRNRFLVVISNLKKFGSFYVFFSVHMRNLLFSRDSKVLFSRIFDQKLIFE